MLCISASFLGLHGPDNWLKYFFGLFLTFLVIIYDFKWFFVCKQEKNVDKTVFLATTP